MTAATAVQSCAATPENRSNAQHERSDRDKLSSLIAARSPMAAGTEGTSAISTRPEALRTGATRTRDAASEDFGGLWR